MSETSLIASIRKQAARQPASRSVVRGIGDDCAILRPGADHDLVFTTDFVLEDRHFTLATHQPADIGHKALARSLSDLAAMGSRPVFCLVSLALPPTLGPRWVAAFYRGLLRLAALEHITLAGGDLANFPQVVADVMCCGSVPRNQALLRSTARPGDLLYVTGRLGASAHAFRLQQGSPYAKRHLRSEPRVQAGLRLRALGVSSCMDLSDGLSLDLRRLCLESKVSAALDDGALPIAPHASLDDALHGGEDYELLFTAPPHIRVPKAIGRLSVTRIGKIVAGRPGMVRYAGRALKPAGFDHFS